MKKSSKKTNYSRGFTLIELMIVIAIIGILAAIAVPQFQSYRIKGFNTQAKSDAKSLYTAAQGYFTDSPNAVINSTVDLSSYGYRTTTGVVPTAAGTFGTLQITTTHVRGTTTFTVDPVGHFTPY